MAISALRTAARSAPEISPILTELINGEKSKDNIIIHGILKKTKILVTSATSWPIRKNPTINSIFNTKDIRKFASVTESYLNKKASNAVKH